MKKGNKANTIFSLILYVITLLVCITMFFPRNVGNVLEINYSAEKTYTADNVTSQINCELSKDGYYKILGGDPQFILPIKSDKIESVKVTATSEIDQPINLEIYTALSDGNFSAQNCYIASILVGRQNVVVDVPEGQYSYLRVDINTSDVVLESIEVFDEQPTVVPFSPNYSALDYIITVIFPIIVAIVAWVFNEKLKIFEKTARSIKKNRINIITVIIFAIVALLFSVLLELLIGVINAEDRFNFYRWILFFGIAELIVVFVFGYKTLKEKPENMFLPIALILGAVMLFGSPIKHICWDFDSHYPWAVQASYPGTTYVTASYNAIDNVAAQSLVLSDSNHKEDLQYLSQADEILVSQMPSEISISHLPAGVFMAVARWFGGDFQVKYNAGRLAYLLVYAFACYFAIKKLKSGKMILAVICLFPTNLFLATNYAYDWCVTAFCILGTAYFVSELQQPDKPISTKDTIIMGLAFALGALPKLVYIVLMGMTLFMRKNWSSKQEKRKYYIIISIIFVIVMAMFMLRANSSIGGSGDSRGGAVNPPEQLAGILSDPIGYAKMLFKFLLGYLSIGNMKDYISNFAYLGIGKYSIIFVISIFVTAITDADGKTLYKIPIYMRALSVMLYIGMAALIASALYLSFTPVGMQTVNGCQARYITPLLAPIILIVTGKRFNIIKNKAIYNGCVLAALSAGGLLETYSQILKIMI